MTDAVTLTKSAALVGHLPLDRCGYWLAVSVAYAPHSQQRIAGLYSRHIGQVATVLTPGLEARILECTRHAPSSSTHWTTRKLAAHLDVSHMMVARVWRKHGLKPHRIERYMASNIRTLRRRRPISLVCI